MKNKVSVIILAGNRQELIENCLKSVVWVNEKILVDLGSNDKTVAMAKKHGCKIIKALKEYNFSLWRNQGAKKASGGWLLYLDADERVPKTLAEEILKTVKHTSHSAFLIPRKNFFLGKEFKTEWPDYQLRLMKKKDLLGWEGKVHEKPKMKGSIAKFRNSLIHLSHRSLESALINTLAWSKLEAENRFKAGHPKMTGLRFFRVVLTGFWEQFIKEKRWKEGTEGFIDGIYQVFSLFFTYYRLWQIQRGESLKKSYKKIDKQIEFKK
jgi:glycosyltransferase involved in cell wall biosynthesis